VYASDLSVEAVELARRNMVFLGLEDRVRLEVGDLLTPMLEDGLGGAVDLLTCNPPYISTARVAEMPDEIASHEPSLAFDGGPLGVRILQRLIRDSPELLRPGGWLTFEVGAGQGSAVEHRLRKSADYGQIERVVDEMGEVRVLLARRN
jgi:release factor glutamine methyltransferase